jgi:hypothetical protein
MRRLAEVELFHVSNEMTDLAVAAARSIPDFKLMPEDVPVPSGLMVFGSPPGHTELAGEQIGIKAVCWSPSPGEPDVLAGSLYWDKAEVGPVIKRHAKVRDVSQEPKLIYAHGTEFTWAFGDNTGARPDQGTFLVEFAPVLRATWLLMQQTVARVSDAHLDRAARRRMERRRAEPKPVRVIELRRAQQAGANSESDREYHHRWIVRGHWRQQWYPAREVHRPVWIAPHIKGPDDKPLLGGEKVYSWTK